MALSLAAVAALCAGPALAQYRPSYPPPGSPPPAPALVTPVPGSQGQVLYFCKPADATAPLSGSGAGTMPATDSAVTPAALIPATSPAAMAPANTMPDNPASPMPQWAPPGFPQIPKPLAPAPSSPLPQSPAIPLAPTTPGMPPAQLAPGVPPGMPTAQPVQPGIPQAPPYQRTPAPATAQPPAPGMPPMMVQPDPRVLSPEDATMLPPREAIFRMLPDSELEKWVMEKVRISQNIAPGDPTLKFPSEELIGEGLKYQAKTSQYPPRQALIEPTYLVHRRLLFEEKNAERQGWDLGFVQPLVSVAYFYKDFVMLPATLANGFAEGFWDTSAGKCLPGSPTPYILYPLGLTCSGGLVEGVFITGLSFAFVP